MEMLWIRGHAAWRRPEVGFPSHGQTGRKRGYWVLRISKKGAGPFTRPSVLLTLEWKFGQK